MSGGNEMEREEEVVGWWMGFCGLGYVDAGS